MKTPRLSPEQINQISGLVGQYITTQQAQYRPTASPLSAEQASVMAGFFSAELLGNTRLIRLHGIRVTDPDFYPMLRDMGFSNLPDQSGMAAITFSDTIVSHGPLTYELLFHELVHVEQYRQLGIGRFAELYVGGFLSGGSYAAIPLERNAYQLSERYAANPLRCFSVVDNVAEWIADGRL